MRAWWLLALVPLLAGCLAAGPAAAPADPTASPDAGREGRPGPQATDPAAGPSGGPAAETTLHRNGTVVLRAAGDGGPSYLARGDDHAFCFQLPTNVTAVRGVFTYAPRQQAGLEFHGPHGLYRASWDGMPPDFVPESPIRLQVDRPDPGRWFVAGGPGSVGGAMDWSLDLTMVTAGTPSAQAVAAFLQTDPAC